ncbi:hypothetical protein B0H14DRAFT_2914037 [Mycena olivaceomarginata]|nr:hypothetical protein B0H14DRAFT_2914037 [Mycena olivaceomarginata]
MLGHVVKRGMAHLQDVSPEYVAKLEEDSQLYGNSDYGMVFIDPRAVLPVLITSTVVFVILASIQYTHGQVVASLAMIESPSSNLIVKRNEPAYTDEKPLIPAPELDADVELTLINHKPITASLCGTLVHLRRVGGWFAHWRGLHISILYMILHAAFTHIFGASRLISIAGCVLLSPVHMLWTHSIIALPRTARLIHLKQCTPLVLPTLIVALAQQATCFLPSLVGSLLDLRMSPEQVWIAAQGEPLALALLGLRILAVPFTFAVIALFVLLPAAATLTRIEAALLPADVHTIVPFDGSFAMAGLSSKALFVAAWRSFDRAAPLRVLKVYAKMLFVQFAVLLIGTAVMTAEVYSRLTLAYTSARALLELNALEHNGLSW